MGKTQFDQTNTHKKFAPRNQIKLIISFFSLLFVFMNESAMAEYSFTRHPTTEAGWRSLPPYCKVKVLSIEAEYATWNRTMGSVFGHIHHYCAGLNFMNNYYKSRTKEDKSFSLNSAINEIGYVINMTEKTNDKMRPEFFVNRGKAYLLLGRATDGVSDMMKAIELNPQTTEAYIALARYYSEAHKKDKALQFATDGLRYLPSSKALQRIYSEMGGKQPYPEPYEKKEAPNLQTSTHPTSVEAELPAMNQPPAGAPPAPTNNNHPVKEPESPIPLNSTPIGSPTNPWCRFCTE